MNKKVKRLVAWFGNFVYHMHNSNKMVACTFCRIKGFKHINSGIEEMEEGKGASSHDKEAKG
jgi:hypothetical protein